MGSIILELKYRKNKKQVNKHSKISKENPQL